MAEVNPFSREAVLGGAPATGGLRPTSRGSAEANPFSREALLGPAPPAAPQPTEPRSWGDTALGLGKAFGSGLEHLVTGTLGMPAYLMGGVTAGLGDAALRLQGASPEERAIGAEAFRRLGSSGLPATEDLNRVVPGADYQAQGPLESVVQGATPFIAGALMAPGSAAVRGLNALKLGVAPYAASELAGKATRGLEVGGVPVEPAARFAASLAAPSIAQGVWQRARTPFGEVPVAREPALRTVQAELGGPITPSSAHGGRILQNITDTLRNVPGGRGQADLADDLARFEARALERAGVGTQAPPLPGGIRPQPVLPGESPIPSQRSAFDTAYGRLERMYGYTPTPTDVGRVRAAAQVYARDRPNTQIGNESGVAIERIADQIEQAQATGAAIRGPAFNELRKDISHRIQTLRGTGQDAAVRALQAQQHAIMHGMGRSIRAVNPADAAAWTDITRRYAQYAPIRQAYGDLGITPQSYARALKSGKNAAAFAEDRLPEAPFARAAVEILPREPHGITSGQIAKTTVTGAAYQSNALGALTALTVGPVLANTFMHPRVQRWWGAVDRAGNPVRVTPLPPGPERLPAILGALGSAVAAGRDPIQPIVVEKGDKRQTRVRVPGATPP